MANACLTALPAELLLHIIELNGGRDDPKTLHNLCLICHHLRDIAQPILFTQYDMPAPIWHPDDNSPVHTFPAERRLVVFCRTVLERPDLAAATKHLNLGSDTNWDDVVPHITPEDTTLFSQAVGLTTLSRINWEDTLAIFELSAVVFLLLAHLPNTVVFTFNPGYSSTSMFTHDNGPIKRVLPVESFTQLMPALRMINLGGKKGYDFCAELHDFARFFYLPTVYSFRIDYACTSERDLFNVLPKSWGTTHLHLTNCFSVDHKFLERFLNCFSALKVFQYSLKDRESMEGFELSDNFTPAEFVQAGQAHTTSLQHLDMDLGNSKLEKDFDENGGWGGVLYHWQTYGSLHAFKKLKALAIDSHRLKSMEDLPENLETLIIRNVYGIDSQSFRNLVSLVTDLSGLAQSLPKLQNVIVHAKDIMTSKHFTRAKNYGETVMHQGTATPMSSPASPTLSPDIAS
ncbi:hypothetical protein CC80DRAFT_582494 [Byssothecium circinans]|uniref:F-box domain-containing protein n=1 Tax=Byssothecium circinans TaxID=147558 RepID=A0A6A5UGC6_9PLEO|nr:hypothetical protein CC80DRAFT_582494 [Byssothecium circinans]